MPFKIVNGQRVEITQAEQDALFTLGQPSPRQIDFRQLLIGARRAGWITDQEAQAWAARTALPQIVAQIIAQLPVDQQIDARLTALTMRIAERDNALINAAAAVGMPNMTQAERDAAVDTLFTQWALI